MWYSAGFLFFSTIIILRIWLETVCFAQHPFLTPFTGAHHYFWYLGVVLWFMVAYRYIIKIKPRKTGIVFLGAPLVFIPILYAMVTNRFLELKYIVPSTFSKTFSAVISFGWTDSNNHSFFYELVPLFIISTAFSWLMSRSWKKTAAFIIIGFYGSFIFFGFHLWGVIPTKAVVKFHAALPNHPALWGLFFLFAAGLYILLLLPEILTLARKTRIRRYLALFMAAGATYLIFLALARGVVYQGYMQVFDYTVTCLISCIAAAAVFAMADTRVRGAWKFFSACWALAALTGLAGFVFGVS